MSFPRTIIALALFIHGVLFSSTSLLNVVGAADRQAARVAHFETHVRPLLAGKCVKCHGEKKQEGGLRLDSREAILRGGESGPAMIVGAPGKSLIIAALRYESFEMPPSGQLPEGAVGPIAAWIAAGAVWPEGQVVREASATITEVDRQWWAFQPVGHPKPLVVKNDGWSRNPVDQYVLVKQRERGLTPAPEASRETLIRRLYFDLIGVPPTPEEVDAFVVDKREDAWEQWIDRLLEDPRYGEHQARFWLDLVRYSESDGWNQDAYRPHIWRYRDYVVNAFNSDKPYPQFVLEQLAGDELNEDNPEHLDAVGFLRLGIYEYNQRDARSHWDDIMNEMTDVAGDVFFGMSMACARCHDHKFDPVPQQDYFKLRAFFEPVIWRDDLTASTAAQREAHAQQLAKWEEATASIRAQLDELEKPYRDRKWKSTVAKFPLDIQACYDKPESQRTSWEQQMYYLIARQFEEEGGGPFKSLSKEDKAKREELQKELAKFDELKPAALPPVMAVTDFAGKLSETVIPDAGDGAVPPGFLTVLDSLEIPVSLAPASKEASEGEGHLAARPTSYRRTSLARWVGDPENPLTHRVMVNRVWQQHFGRGIVATPNDFGHNGQPPTHPELINWLTREFIDSNGSVKQLHKTILMSAAWRQAATHPNAQRQQEADPNERWLWRAPVRRLRAEQIRDAMLSVSGELDGKFGGPSVDEAKPRRGLYVKSYRNTTETFLHAFDMANGLKSVAERNNTTTPTQSLLMINGGYSLARAKALALRVIKDTKGAGPDGAIRRAVKLTWGREPGDTELQRLAGYLTTTKQADEGGDVVDVERLTDICHVLMNSNEFTYLD